MSQPRRYGYTSGKAWYPGSYRSRIPSVRAQRHGSGSLEIVALRALGLSLAQVARVLAGDHQNLGTALAAHEARLEEEIGHLVCKIDKARALRADIARGQMPADGELTRLLYPEFSVSFELPWPWGGELFELRDIRPLNYIIGPLGSGKTRLALRLAEAFPNAAFLSLDRLNDGGAATMARLNADSALKSRVNQGLEWLLRRVLQNLRP